jgi:hypothetical protein
MRAVGKKTTKRETMMEIEEDWVKSDKEWRKKVRRWKTTKKVKEETRNILKGEEWGWWRNQPATKTDENVPRAH